MTIESWLQLSKVISYIGLFLVFVSTVSSSILSSKLDGIKDQRIDTLVKGNNELLKKIDIYQEDLENKQKTIEELQIETKKSARGITTTYDYKGVKRDNRPGVIKAVVGEETNVFEKMLDLREKQQWPDLIELSTEQISKTPEWYTPYLFRGIARANIGELNEALKDVSFVVENTPGDPEYTQAIDILKRIKRNLDSTE